MIFHPLTCKNVWFSSFYRIESRVAIAVKNRTHAWEAVDSTTQILGPIDDGELAAAWSHLRHRANFHLLLGRYCSAVAEAREESAIGSAPGPVSGEMCTVAD